MQNKYKYESPIDTKLLQYGLIVGMVAITSFGTTAVDLLGKIPKLPKLPFQQQQSIATPQKQYQQANFTGNSKKWDLIWKQEGTGCQNWANDTANRGGAWFTCLGITQTAWNNYRRSNPSLPGRVEVAYRQDKETFKKHAIIIYKQQYCQPVQCDQYQGPLPALLMAISANGGPGTARKHLRSTEGITNPKERAMAIAKLEHARYDRIAANNPSQRGFRRGGWQQNIDNRYAYINSF